MPMFPFVSVARMVMPVIHVGGMLIVNDTLVSNVSVVLVLSATQSITKAATAHLRFVWLAMMG